MRFTLENDREETGLWLEMTRGQRTESWCHFSAVFPSTYGPVDSSILNVEACKSYEVGVKVSREEEIIVTFLSHRPTLSEECKV